MDKVLLKFGYGIAVLLLAAGVACCMVAGVQANWLFTLVGIALAGVSSIVGNLADYYAAKQAKAAFRALLSTLPR